MKVSHLIDQLYWVTKFGRPKRKISTEELFANPGVIENPIFFLSTGRCGTKWFTHVLEKEKSCAVFHDPTPNLSVQNKFIYTEYQKDKEAVMETSRQILFAGREQHFRFAYKTEKRYVETNNHITFFAHSLAELFPTAKFVHLYRHPGDFTTSGLNRGWFEHNIAATEKTITPINNQNWREYSPLEKIGWVWNETNQFIEDFKKEHSDRCFSYDFTKRDPVELSSLFQLLNISFSNEFLQKSLKTKRNIQKDQTFPSYSDWKESEKKSLRTICGELAKKYKYVL